MSRQVTGRTGLLCLLGSLVHFLTDQYTGTRTNGCSDSCTDGSTFSLTGQSSDQSTQRSTSATADKSSFGRIAHTASAENQTSAEQQSYDVCCLFHLILKFSLYSPV